jgi:hypothetical protein
VYLHYRNDGNHRPRNEKGARQSNSWLTEWDNVMDFDVWILEYINQAYGSRKEMI